MHRTRAVNTTLLIVALVWGSSYVAAKDATGVLPVITVLFVRYALSCAAALAGIGVFRVRVRAAELRAGFVLGLTQCAVLLLETYGVAHTSASHAGLIISLTILVTPLLDRCSALPARFLLAAAMSVLGVALLVSNGTDPWAGAGIGDGLMLTAAVVRGAHVVLVGRLADERVRPLALTTVQAAVGSLVLVPFAVGNLGRLGEVHGTTWAALAYLAVACSVFAFLAQTWAVQRTSPSRSSLLLGTEPVWALLAGAAFAGDRLGASAVAGAALIVAGTYWGQAIERRSRADRSGTPSLSETASLAGLRRPRPPRADDHVPHL